MSKYVYGDLINVELELPDGTIQTHPYLIISSDKIHTYENSYVGIMMTGNSKRDRLSFPVNNDMFEAPLDKPNCQFRLHIISSFAESKCRTFRNRMNPIYIKQLLKQIQLTTFGIDCK